MVSDAKEALHPVSTQVDSPELGRSCCNTALEDTGWGTVEGPPQLVNLLWGSSLAPPTSSSLSVAGSAGPQASTGRR